MEKGRRLLQDYDAVMDKVAEAEELSADHRPSTLEKLAELAPRGSAGLIQYVVKNATVPVIETGAGICHLYVDQEANLDMALEIAKNAKIQRPSVCNAIETILVHQKVAPEFLPKLQEIFKSVQIYGDEKTRKIIDCLEATEKNYATEYDDYICNIKVVDDIEEAIEHIYNYSTKHSESIITENKETAKYFMESLDSACVYHNASTRFSDGGHARALTPASAQAFSAAAIRAGSPVYSFRKGGFWQIISSWASW